MRDCVLAIDQGTTGSTVLVMDATGKTLARSTREFAQHYPEPGWVEHDPNEIWTSVTMALAEVLKTLGPSRERIAAIGITNQRETTLIWDRKTGEPVGRAVVWQDRRTSARCAELKSDGYEPLFRKKTGLVLDPYFSGTKLAWMLDRIAGGRERAARGELAFGTVDSYLVHRLSMGHAHRTDVTNASRTLLMDLETLAWDDELLSILGVPREVLPEIVPSAGPIAEVRADLGLPRDVWVTGIAGDQQSALFGQACFERGNTKCTYGTGAFALTNVGARPLPSAHGLLTTVAWKVGDEVAYALEGSSFIAGAAVQWLRDGLGLIRTARDIETLAAGVPSSDGVVFVPALTGLGAPHWDPGARGLLCGITRGTTAAHIARATLEGVAFQVADLLGAMQKDLGAPLSKMRVDGGAAANDLMMQFQSDVAGLSIERPEELESTARGAAMLAGIGCGLLASPREASRMAAAERVFYPQAPAEEVAAHRARWDLAVRRAML